MSLRTKECSLGLNQTKETGTGSGERTHGSTRKWKTWGQNLTWTLALSLTSFSALLSVPIFHFPVSRPVLVQRYLACEQALLFGGAKRAARGVASPFACHSRVYFSQYSPNGKLARRLNVTRPPFQSSQTQKQHVTYGENWSYSCIQLALLDIFNSEMWKLENRGKSVHDNKWFKPQWIQVMRFN